MTPVQLAVVMQHRVPGAASPLPNLYAFAQTLSLAAEDREIAVSPAVTLATVPLLQQHRVSARMFLTSADVSSHSYTALPCFAWSAVPVLSCRTTMAVQVQTLTVPVQAAMRATITKRSHQCAAWQTRLALAAAA